MEDFFTKDVRYVVTDKPEDSWPKNPTAPPEKASTSAASGSDIKKGEHQAQLSPDKTKNSNHPVLPVNQSLAHPTGSASTACQQVMSSVGTKGTTDVLELAVRRSVKVISVQYLLAYLLNHVEFPDRQLTSAAAAVGLSRVNRSNSHNSRNVYMMSRDHEATDPGSKMKSVKAIPLDSPFIKIESLDERQRPSFKTFKVWPDINFSTTNTGCPFKPTGGVGNTANTTRGNGMGTTATGLTGGNNNHQQQRVTPTPTGRSNLTPLQALMMQHQHQQKSSKQQLTTGNNTSGVLAGANGILTMTTGVKKKVMSYCEVCSTEYDHLPDHLKTPKHESYARDDDNFQILQSVIRSLPKISDLETLDDNNDDDDQENDTDLESPAPYMTSKSCSARITGGRGANHFIQLTDLMLTRDKDPLEEEDVTSAYDKLYEFSKEAICKRIKLNEEDEPHDDTRLVFNLT